MNKDPQTYEIIGAAMEVHRQLGRGFLESVCREAPAIELAARENLHRALLINFGAPSLDYKRLVFNLRESAQFADKIKDLNLTGVQLG